MVDGSAGGEAPWDFRGSGAHVAARIEEDDPTGALPHPLRLAPLPQGAVTCATSRQYYSVPSLSHDQTYLLYISLSALCLSFSLIYGQNEIKPSLISAQMRGSTCLKDIFQGDKSLESIQILQSILTLSLSRYVAAKVQPELNVGSVKRAQRCDSEDNAGDMMDSMGPSTCRERLGGSPIHAII